MGTITHPNLFPVPCGIRRIQTNSQESCIFTTVGLRQIQFNIALMNYSPTVGQDNVQCNYWIKDPSAYNKGRSLMYIVVSEGKNTILISHFANAIVLSMDFHKKEKVNYESSSAI